MGALSRSVLTGQDTAEAIVERLRETFGQDAVSLLERGAGGLDGAGLGRRPRAPRPPTRATPGSAVDDDHVLALCGEPLRASDQRVLEAFAVQTGLVLEYRRLRERDERAAALERAEATSTALLRAVSHDLRTPLATMRAAVDGLLAAGSAEADRRRAGRAPSTAPTEQLERLIDNLLDLSRLQTGLLHPVLRAAQPRRGAAARGRRPPAGRRAPRGRRAGAAGHHRRRAARAGGRQPGRQRGPASPAARRCGCWRTCCPRRSR